MVLLCLALFLSVAVTNKGLKNRVASSCVSRTMTLRVGRLPLGSFQLWTFHLTLLRNH